MQTEVYSLMDRKAGVFGRPVFVPALGLLVRELQDALKGDDVLARHPEDFVVYRLGKFDDVNGRFELLALPDFVLDVSSLVVRPVGPGASVASVAPAAEGGQVQ